MHDLRLSNITSLIFLFSLFQGTGQLVMYGEAPSDNGLLPDDQGGDGGSRGAGRPRGNDGGTRISATNSSSNSTSTTADLTLYIVFGVAILVFVLVLIIIVKILKRKNPNPNGYTLTSTGKCHLFFRVTVTLSDRVPKKFEYRIRGV